MYVCVRAGPSGGPDRPRAPGGGGRARRKSGIIMSELGAGLRVPGSNATVSQLQPLQNPPEPSGTFQEP